MFGNVLDFSVRGIEYQLGWEPWRGSRLRWQQSFSHLEWADPVRNLVAQHQPPARASTLACMQQLPRGFDLALMWYERTQMTWDKDTIDRMLPAASRVDLRLARNWRFDGRKAELALTVQALNGEQQESRTDFLFKRRTFLTLKLEH